MLWFLKNDTPSPSPGVATYHTPPDNRCRSTACASLAREIARAAADLGKARMAFTCSGTPRSVSPDAMARLAFCGESLCDLTIFVSFDGADKEADAQLLSILKALKEKYGEPAKHETGGLAHCRSQGIVRCTSTGGAFLTREWEWTGGEQIFLALKGKEGKATLAVRYLTQKKPTPGAAAF